MSHQIPRERSVAKEATIRTLDAYLLRHGDGQFGVHGGQTSELQQPLGKVGALNEVGSD